MAKKFVNNVNEKNLILTRAQAACLSRDFATAVRLYKMLLKDDPSNVDYLKEIGSIYVKGGEDEKAIPYYEQIITFYPHYIDAMTALGAIFRRLKRYDESIEILTRALDEGRQSGTVNYNLGFTYKEMGNFSDAIEAFQIVISENPGDVLAYNHIGNIYLEQKNYEKAISSFKRGLQVDQNHPILNYNLARCYSEAKVYPDAVRCFESALRSKPGWIDAIKDFSSLLIECQKTEEASELVKNAINVHPNNTKLLVSLGRIYLNEFDYDSAEQTFQRAERIDGNDLEVLQGLFESFDRNGKSEEALDTAIKEKEIAPENLDVKKDYASALLSVGEFEAAGTNIKELVEENGESDPELMDLYGQYYICAGEDEKAKDCFDKIKINNRSYKNYRLHAAKRYSQIGKPEQAEVHAKEFIAQDIKNPRGYNALGKIYEASGNYQGAIDAFGKSKALKRPNVQADKKISSLINRSAGISVDMSVPEHYESALDDILKQKEEEYIEKTVGAEARAIVEEAEEEFDFGQMGDNVPMGEALVEKEDDFFDGIDEATGEPYKTEEEKEAEEIQKKIDALNHNPYEGLEDGVSPLDALNSLEAAEAKTDKNALLGNSAAKDIPSAEKDVIEYDDFNSPEFLNSSQEPDPFEEMLPQAIQPSAPVETAPAYGGAPAESYSTPVMEEPEPEPVYMQEPSKQQQYVSYDLSFTENRLTDMVQNAVAENRRYMENEQSRFEQQMAEEQRNFALQMAEEQRRHVEEQEQALEQMREEFEKRLDDAELSLEPTAPSENQDIEAEDDFAFEALDDDEAAVEEAAVEETEAVTEEIAEEVSEDDFTFEALDDEEAVVEETEVEETEAVTEDSSADSVEVYGNESSEESAALFKKLLSLCEYLPEDEKKKFRSGKIRLQMEFLISKMSGQPGLLATTLKNEAAGEVEVSMEDISNDKIKKLMCKMKDLSENLDDPQLAQSLINSAEAILEKIQLTEEDNQIFQN